MDNKARAAHCDLSNGCLVRRNVIGGSSFGHTNVHTGVRRGLKGGIAIKTLVGTSHSSSSGTDIGRVGNSSNNNIAFSTLNFKPLIPICGRSNDLDNPLGSKTRVGGPMTLVGSRIISGFHGCFRNATFLR